MFFPINRLEFEKLKAEYMLKKMEQMREIQDLEDKLNYHSQFFEPKFTIRLGPDELEYIAETRVSFFNRTQPKFIQIEIGKREDFKDYQEVYEKGGNLIMDELMRLFPNEFN